MSKYLVIGVFATAALLFGCYLLNDRNRLADELKASRAEVVQLQADAEFAIQTLAARDALDRKYFEEMADAKKENDGLRAAVAAGTSRLLVRATCPKLPATASSASVDDDTSAELTADARQNYFDLRDQIIETEKQLAGLQEYVRQVVRVVR